MPSDRLLRILELLRADDGGPTAPRLCEVSARVMAMSGAGLMLMSDDVRRGSVCSSNDVSALIEELQFTLGEGPCIDSYHDDGPVLEPDLASPAKTRWVAFAPPAVAAGARAVFGFPMRVGAIRLGALTVYRDQPGPLTDGQHANALVLAEVAARSVLAMQAQAPPGALGSELEVSADLHLVVHQAAGVLAARLDTSIAQALIMMRGHAFANGRLLTDVARDVVADRVHLDDA